ncbi:MAG: tetratricopeptide repeat protein [Casimicrobiaceae bacterium]
MATARGDWMRSATGVLLVAACVAHAPLALGQSSRAVPGGYDPCNNPNAYKLPECQRPTVAPPRPQLETNTPAGMPSGAAGSKAAQLWQQGSAYFERRDYRQAMTAYREGAALGDPRPMAVIGNMYREGLGVPVDRKQAAQWYERAAAGGSRSAQYSLADMLESADGIPRDVARAAKLYEQSARQGFPDAQFALGISYEFGQGVPRNRRTATYWLDQAARQGDGRANWFSSWLKSSATPQFNNPDQLRDYIDGKVDARMLRQMNVGNTMCSTAPWVCSRERAEALWKSEYHPPNTPNPFRN